MPDIEITRLNAITEWESYMEKTWDEYKVSPFFLEQEMTTTAWRLIKAGKKYHWISYEQGIGCHLISLIEKCRDQLLLAESIYQISIYLGKAKTSVTDIALYLWAKGIIQGPLGSLQLSRKAHQADNLAKYYDREGKPNVAEGQRRRAKLLRDKASGKDVELKPRGVTTKTRFLYAQMETEGPKDRKELIGAAIAQGIHPGTAAVQYAQYRREQKNDPKSN